jgi:hypothetical protein
VLSFEQSSERLLPGFSHDAFPHPLPKLCLCCPKLFPVPANHKRCLLFTFFLLVHADTPMSLRGEFRPATHSTRWGSLSREAAASCQNGRRIPTPVISRCLRIRRLFDSATNGSEYSELVLVVTLGNSLKSINVSVNH